MPDTLAEAYAAQYPDLAAEHSLLDHWQLMQARGSESAAGFVSGLKGKLAEIKAVDVLEQNGFTNVSIADSPVQEAWDISAGNEAGELIFFQVKTGTEGYAGSVTADMGNAPDIEFLLGSELYGRIGRGPTELADRITDIGPDYVLVDGIQDGLSTLSDNLGIDVPDGIGEIIPYAGSILIATRLICDALRAEREFQETDRTTMNKIHVVQALALMSCMGISTVLATVGGMGGATIGSAVPFIGNLVGGGVGTVAGAGVGMSLNRQLQPHLLNLGLSVTGLTHDDLFYFKNKPRIDQVALSFRQTADALIGTA